MKEDYNFSRIWRDKKQFPHSLNVTILVKQKEIIGGLVRALNLTVRLTSTGLALKVRLQFRTCSHLFCFSFFLLENG